MREKKWRTMLVGCLLLALLATGCTSSETEGSSETEDLGQVTEVQTTGEVTIAEKILVDQNGIVITATEYTTDSVWGDGIKLLIENNSDVNVTVSCKALIVNDYMISDLFVSEVAAGKKANETMYLSNFGLEEAGIDTVGKVEVAFRVYDSATYSDIFATDLITIQTSAFESMDTVPDDTGTELYNEGGIRIVGRAVDNNAFWGTAILLYIENNSGSNVTVSCDNLSVNGFMMTPYFSSSVYNGKKAIDDITMMSSELEANGIETVGEVECQFRIFETDTYQTITETSPITFSAQ
jgi:hypothetical protein